MKIFQYIVRRNFYMANEYNIRVFDDCVNRVQQKKKKKRFITTALDPGLRVFHISNIVQMRRAT